MAEIETNTITRDGGNTISVNSIDEFYKVVDNVEAVAVDAPEETESIVINNISKLKKINTLKAQSVQEEHNSSISSLRNDIEIYDADVINAKHVGIPVEKIHNFNETPVPASN